MDAAAASQRRLTPRETRNQAAQCIQKTFRGWRARRRVVWRVRDELSAVMEAMEAEVEVERVLLGMARPHTSTWLYGKDGDRKLHINSEERRVKKTLHLPRIEDDVFGWTASFPSQEEEASKAAAATRRENDYPSGEEAIVGARENACEDQESGAGSVGAVPSEKADSESALPPLHTNKSVEALQVNLPEVVPTGGSSTSEEPKTEDDGLPDLAHGRSAVTTAETVIATHSKEEIEQELRWAKRALRDRLQYLRSHRRTTQRQSSMETVTPCN